MKPINQSFSKTIFKIALLVVFLVSYSCNKEAVEDPAEVLSAVNASAKKNTKERPWKIETVGTFGTDFSLPGCGPLLPLKIEGSGKASHVGNLHVVLTWCTGGIGGPDNFIIDGVITAANGDEIWFQSTGLFRPFEIDYIVTGGTGRFKEAGGEFTLTQTEFEIVNVTPEGFPSGTYANEGVGHIVY